MENVKRHRGRPVKKTDLMIDARFSVSFPCSRDEELRAAAQAQGLSLSAYARQILLRHLDASKPKRVRKRKTA